MISFSFDLGMRTDYISIICTQHIGSPSQYHSAKDKAELELGNVWERDTIVVA